MANDPLLGRQFGNVRLTACLGHGSMGVVYRGYHESFAKEVAVKLLLKSKGEKKASSRARFLREGQAAAKIRHENVVQVMDAGEEAGGVAYIVMEYVKGMSLGDILEEAKVLGPDVVRRIGADIANGLAAIHAQGIVHRDIKPDNVLIGEDQRAKITDLGLAKQLESEGVHLTATGVVVGTPLYVSPEAIRDPRTITGSADIYSLGATLYHMLTGSPPFLGDSPFDVMRGHLEEPIRPIRELKPEIPEELAKAVESCLDKWPNQRPTPEALANILLGGEGRTSSKSRGVYLMLAVAAVVVVCIAAIGWKAITRKAAPEETLTASANAPTTLRIRSTDPRGSKVAVDNGAWQVVSDQPIKVKPGSHHLEVMSDGSGPLKRWKGDITVPEHGNADVPVELSAVTVPTVRVEIPGTGMLFVDGASYGTDQLVTFTTAGVHSVSRCIAGSWSNLQITIDERGKQTATSPSTSDAPSREAYWKPTRASISYHVVCWWEAERARQRSQLPTPVGWFEQGKKQEQPAIGMSTKLIQAVRTQLKLIDANMPNREQALALAVDLQSAIWCEYAGKLDVVGGGSEANAMLVMVSTRR